MKRRLPECEEEVMSVVWKCETSPDLKIVLDMVNETFNHDWKPQTVSTFLVRLRKKGYLSAKRKGRYTFYTPIIEMSTYKQTLLDEINRLF